jgi:hypothetical protein
MQKLVLTSVLLATFAIPVWIQRRGEAGDPFRAVLRRMLAFAATYVFLLLYVYPRLA